MPIENLLYFVAGLIVLNLLISGWLLFERVKTQAQKISAQTQKNQLAESIACLKEAFANDHQLLLQLKEYLVKEQQVNREHFNLFQVNNLRYLQEGLQQGMQTVNLRIDKLMEVTEAKLGLISGQVEKRLMDGFSQTTTTFSDVVKRLALIDQAQKRITELSDNVVSLQEILMDKKARGTFGEVQLSALIQNCFPPSHFSLQYTFSNGKRADCVIFFPPPTGTIAIDSKFPLENYRRQCDSNLTIADRKFAEQQFRMDIRKHLNDVATKYIISNETSEGAILFIPAEGIFAELHARFYDLVEEAQRLRVWLVSPTTLMAILTTARAVLKDAATREQVHLIQNHLGELAKDFNRFQVRMDNLSRHIQQAQVDVKEVKTSADKIVNSFIKIEKVELEHAPSSFTVNTALLSTEERM